MQHMIGVETEFSITGLDPGGQRVSPRELCHRLDGAVKSCLTCMPDHGGRQFLSNGGLFYVDYGAHPEYATPECTSPDDAVRYVQAGDAIMERLADCLQQAGDIAEVRVFKGNVDYLNPDVTWGCHESYLYRSNLHAGQLIPHLVSRLIFSGSGGWNNRSPGLEFTLSPRAHHMRKAVSGDSTGVRGIFHTRNESHCGRLNLNRLHLLCGESVFSEIGNWLKLATTALVVALIDHQPGFADPVRLVSPVEAMRTFATDPGCRSTAVLMHRRKRLTALQIQRFYLDAVEAHLQAGFMPSWAPLACRRWRSMLDRIEQGAATVSVQLDWAIKYAIYREWVSHHSSIPWESFSAWNLVVSELCTLGIGDNNHAEIPEYRLVRSRLKRSDRQGHTLKMLGDLLAGSGQCWEQLDEFRHLRNRLFEFDTRFGEVGKNGLFRMLDADRVLQHRLLKARPVSEVINNPPRYGRPALRGYWIRRLRRSKRRYHCSWEIIESDRRYLDLSDPFVSRTRWKSRPPQDCEI